MVFLSSVLSAKDSVWNKFRQKALNQAKTETVYLDNMFVQSYNGVEGVWQQVNSWQEWSRYIQKYGTNKKKFFSMNQITPRSQGLWSGQYVFFPFSEEVLKKMRLAGIARQKWEIPKAQFLWPAIGGRITSRVEKRWGQIHTGIDVSVPTGTPVIAAQDGEVTIAGPQGAYGQAVFIDHGLSYTTRYGHLSRIFVRKGDKVKKGQVIALSGNTGRSTGPHLHFEVRSGDIVLNPEFYLPEFRESMDSAMEFETNLMYVEKTMN